MKVLIVEDSDEMRRLIRTLLTDVAEQVHECIDGAAAIAAYERYQPDWVVMDIQLNQVDGITATRQIKAAHPDAKVVIVTGYDETALHQEARAAGAGGYVLKENLVDLVPFLRSFKTQGTGTGLPLRLTDYEKSSDL